MKRAHLIQTIFLFGIICLTYWGCRQQVYLKADFESDALDGLPNAALQGEPAGDQINYTGSVPSSQIRIIRETGNQWLQWSNSNRLSNRPLSERGNRMVFRANAVTYPAKISYYWKMKITEESINCAFHFELTDGSGVSNVHLVLEDGARVGALAGYGHLYLMPSREFLGRIPVNRICEIWVIVDHETDTFTMTASRPGTGEGNLSVGNHTLSANSNRGLKNPSIELYNYTRPPEFSGLGNAYPPGGIVLLDDLLINRL